MDKTELKIASRNGKQLYQVVRQWYDSSVKEFKRDVTYAIRFDGAVYPSWSRIASRESADSLMNQ